MGGPPNWLEDAGGVRGRPDGSWKGSVRLEAGVGAGLKPACGCTGCAPGPKGLEPAAGTGGACCWMPENGLAGGALKGSLTTPTALTFSLRS